MTATYNFGSPHFLLSAFTFSLLDAIIILGFLQFNIHIALIYKYTYMYENSSTQNTHRTSAWPRKSGSVLHVNLQKDHHYTYVTMARRVRGLWKINIRPRQDLHSFRICRSQFVLNIKASYIFIPVSV